jgi:hypothetical protein
LLPARVFHRAGETNEFVFAIVRSMRVTSSIIFARTNSLERVAEPDPDRGLVIDGKTPSHLSWPAPPPAGPLKMKSGPRLMLNMSQGN